MIFARYKFVVKAFGLVFSRYQYIIVAVTVSLLVYLLLILIRQGNFVFYVLQSDLFNFFQKLNLIQGTLLSIETNFVSTTSLVLTLLLSLVSGINIAMIFYLVRQQIAVNRAIGASLTSIVSSMLGVGCAACGSVILTSLFGLGFTAGLIVFLPLDGVEFVIIALLIMLYSTYYVAKKLTDTMVCKIKKSSEVLG